MKEKLQRTYSFTIRFTGLQLLLWGAGALLAAYLGWELYWWNKIGLYFIKWHTRIVFSALLWGGVLFAPVYVFSLFKRGDGLKKVLSIAIAVWLALVVSEVLFAITSKHKTYSEERSGFYRSPFDPEPENVYHIYNSGKEVSVKAPEFTFSIEYNALGFAGAAWAEEKTNRQRIITLGDSFTEGDGAPMDSCYPALLQHMLGNDFEILNAGVRGSDPVFGIKNMEDRLLPYRPDVVVQAVSENDVLFDFCIRGGYERFQPDSTVRFNSPPWWEPLYAMSYSLRMFMHAAGCNMSEPCGSKTNPALIADHNRILKEVFDRYEKLAAQNGFTALMLFYPTKYEVFRNAYDFDFSEAKQYIETLPHVQWADAFPCYRQKISASGMRAEDFYWTIDGHHNPRGYHLMAQCVAEALGAAKEK